MPADDAQLWQLLHSLDDPDHREFPANYNHQRARARFNQLAERVNRDFSCQCWGDREVQDASFHGRIDIPAAATTTGERLVIVVSNFGDLAPYCPSKTPASGTTRKPPKCYTPTTPPESAVPSTTSATPSSPKAPYGSATTAPAAP
ncbi:hypothetical protein [Micromonospora sp. NPDC050276]|uniref:hypothetical protein n=1 Tax=Micromonospora sp. NPDC050276 TaxID=3364278 RepID=UPI0037A50405